MLRRIPLFHRLLALYVRGPGHPAKLRIVAWLIRSFQVESIFAETEVGLMRLNLRDFIQQIIFFRGTYEGQTLHLMGQLLSNGDCFVDVGANVGIYSLAAARRVGAKGRVVAIEPNPEICAELLFNRRLNNQEQVIMVVAAAATDAACLLPFAVPTSTAGLNRGRSRELSDVTQEKDWFFVSGTRLSEILARASVSAIKVMKIDVEGSEFRVLRGLFENESVPQPQHILFEFLPNDFSYAKSPNDLLLYLEEHGYEVLTVTGKQYTLGRAIPEDNLWARRKDITSSSSLVESIS